jgi:hypothetical protein
MTKNLAEYNREYYLKNRDRILKSIRDDIVECGCGSKIQKHEYKKHKGTQKHIMWQSLVLASGGGIINSNADAISKIGELLKSLPPDQKTLIRSLI